MRLALRLGRTLGELCETMSSEEFSLWLLMYQEEPWDDSRADLNTGIIASTIANYAGKMRKENAEPARPIDFMPFVKFEVVEDVVEEEPDPLKHFAKFL